MNTQPDPNRDDPDVRDLLLNWRAQQPDELERRVAPATVEDVLAGARALRHDADRLAAGTLDDAAWQRHVGRLVIRAFGLGWRSAAPLGTPGLPAERLSAAREGVAGALAALGPFVDAIFDIYERDAPTPAHPAFAEWAAAMAVLQRAADHLDLAAAALGLLTLDDEAAAAD